MADILNVEGDHGAGEIMTEYEDLGEEEEEAEEAEDAEPVEEEEEVAVAQQQPPASAEDYAVPEANKEVWQKFGYNTEAGRMLRRLYGGGAASSASKVSYPRKSSGLQPWEPPPPGGLHAKPCPQRAVVKVPRPAYPKRDMDDPKNWRVPLPGRRPESEIRAELDDAFRNPERPNLPRGRDQDKAKDHLQDRNHFCGGRMMPPGAMGNVAASSDVPKALPRPAVERREIDENGMNAEQREMFQELTEAIRDKQDRLAKIEADEAADQRPCKDPALARARTVRNKEALQLRNDIDRDLKDVDKFLDIIDG